MEGGATGRRSLRGRACENQSMSGVTGEGGRQRGGGGKLNCGERPSGRPRGARGQQRAQTE